MIEVTPRQHAYLKELASGQRTTRELREIFKVSSSSVRKITGRLEELRLVRVVPHGIAYSYELTTPHDKLNLKIVRARPGRKDNQITDAEIRHTAHLRNEGMTGQELVAEFRKTYPKRTGNSLKGMVRLAKVQGLCR